MATSLRTVDKLTITFLVDNTINWMSKFPPEFTPELRLHLAQPDHGTWDETAGVRVLDFNKFCCGAHGFSALIETFIEGDAASHLTLFDTGPDSLSLVRNIRALQTPIERIERVIISHWHSDHSGGLLSFLSLRKARLEASSTVGAVCTVDLHPNRPELRGIAPGPTYDTTICALPFDPSFEEIEELGAVVDKHAEGHSVSGDTVWVSGEIPRITEYEKGLVGSMRWVTDDSGVGKWIADPAIMDERYAAIDVAGKGLVIFSACSHAGIVNVVKDAVKTFGKSIYMIIGGLHLSGNEYSPRIPATVDFLSKSLRPAPTYILPMHCSGFQAQSALEKEFGEGCVPAGAGLRIDLVGNRAMDERLPPSSYT